MKNFRGIKNFRQAVGCTFQGPTGTFIYRGVGLEGFFLLDLKTKQVQHVIIDSIHKAHVSPDGQQITSDKSGNIWGTTTDNRGIWHYDMNTQKDQLFMER